MDLRRFQDEAGKELLDLPDAPLPDADTPAPVRLLPHWDANLLVHVRRTGSAAGGLPPELFTSRRPFSAGVILVDGRVVGEWSVRDGHVAPTLYEELPRPADRSEVDDEVAAPRRVPPVARGLAGPPSRPHDPPAASQSWANRSCPSTLVSQRPGKQASRSSPVAAKAASSSMRARPGSCKSSSPSV